MKRVLVGLVAVAGCASAPRTTVTAPGKTPAIENVADASSPQDLVGHAAPGFSLRPLHGTDNVVLPSGQVTVVTFFGGWSTGSTKGLRHLESIHRKYERRGLRVVAVSMDETEKDAAALPDSVGVTFPVVWSGGMENATNRAWASGPYGRENSVFIVDRKGVVRFAHRGGKDGSPAGEPAIDSEIDQVLSEPAEH